MELIVDIEDYVDYVSGKTDLSNLLINSSKALSGYLSNFIDNVVEY